MAQVSEGSSRGRESSFELNLVPFIDLMSCLITFLLITAVWTQITMIKLGSSIYGKQNIEELKPEPPKNNIVLRIDVVTTGYRLIVGKERIEINKQGADFDNKTLKARLEQVKAQYPDKYDAVITMDETLKYNYLIEGMDIVLQSGFPAISVATGGAE